MKENTVKKVTIKKLLKIICTFLDSKLAYEILCLDVKKVSELTDYIIIANGKNERHLKSLCNELKKDIFKLYSIKPYHSDDNFSSNWVVLDYGFIIVHLFIDEMRKHYDIEALFSDAKELKLM